MAMALGFRACDQQDVTGDTRQLTKTITKQGARLTDNTVRILTGNMSCGKNLVSRTDECN